MKNHQYLAEGQTVNFVDPTGKIQKGKITKVINADAAELELGPKASAVAEFSDSKEPGTFHFPAETAAPAAPAGK